MATFIGLLKFTVKGAEDYRESPDRERQFAATAEGKGLSNILAYWTIGSYDGVLLFDAENDETASRAMLELAGEGYVSVEALMRAFNQTEFSSVIGSVG